MQVHTFNLRPKREVHEFGVRAPYTTRTGSLRATPNVNVMTDRRAISHLLRRVTFGPTAAEVDAAARTSLESTLTSLLTPAGEPAPVVLPADPATTLGKDATREQRLEARRQERAQVTEATSAWLERMAAGGGAAEKLTFFWHGHWATSVQKVRSARLMLGQLQTFRRYGAGDTGPLVRAMLRDPALIVWLDGQKNTRTAPNENLARELMELFTLGVGHYTEDDVKAGRPGAHRLAGRPGRRYGHVAPGAARRRRGHPARPDRHVRCGHLRRPARRQRAPPAVPGRAALGSGTARAPPRRPPPRPGSPPPGGPPPPC